MRWNLILIFLADMSDRITGYQLYKSIDRVFYRKKDELRP